MLEDAREPGEWIEGYDDERPILNQFERWLLARYQELASQRGSSMGEVPEAIPVSEIRALWLDHQEVCTSADFRHWMSVIDGETRRFYAEQAEAKKKDEDDTDK